MILQEKMRFKTSKEDTKKLNELSSEKLDDFARTIGIKISNDFNKEEKLRILSHQKPNKLRRGLKQLRI